MNINNINSYACSADHDEKKRAAVVSPELNGRRITTRKKSLIVRAIPEDAVPAAAEKKKTAAFVAAPDVPHRRDDSGVSADYAPRLSEFDTAIVTPEPNRRDNITYKRKTDSGVPVHVPGSSAVDVHVLYRTLGETRNMLRGFQGLVDESRQELQGLVDEIRQELQGLVDEIRQKSEQFRTTGGIILPASIANGNRNEPVEATGRLNSGVPCTQTGPTQPRKLTAKDNWIRNYKSNEGGDPLTLVFSRLRIPSEEDGEHLQEFVSSETLKAFDSLAKEDNDRLHQDTFESFKGMIDEEGAKLCRMKEKEAMKTAKALKQLQTEELNNIISGENPSNELNLDAVLIFLQIQMLGKL